MCKTFLLIALFLVSSGELCWPAIINIPADYPTIQQGIDAGVDGDTVLVQPGTYVENINFNGHNIVLGSLFLTTGDTSYIEQTVIDGDTAGSVVTFENGEESNSCIFGFTIRNGRAEHGGGIKCINSRPTISHNIIVENIAGWEMSGGHGGGIYCDSSSNPIINLNVIAGNLAWELGGGICCLNESNLKIIGNVIFNNQTLCGGGIYCHNSDPIIINNAILENGDVECGGIFFYIYSNPLLLNNIIWGNSGYNRPEIGTDTTSNPTITFCDILGGWPGVGNIDIDPLFRDPSNGDFHLMAVACGDSADSPSIDAGDPAILDSLLDCSWGLGGLRSDMGAYGGGDSATVDIFNNSSYLPNGFIIMQNYPNPFNSGTIIRFSIVRSMEVRLAVYDILGRKVRILIDEYKLAGNHTADFDATGLSSGVYFYRLQAGEAAETRPMVLLR